MHKPYRGLRPLILATAIQLALAGCSSAEKSAPAAGAPAPVNSACPHSGGKAADAGTSGEIGSSRPGRRNTVVVNAQASRPAAM